MKCQWLLFFSMILLLAKLTMAQNSFQGKYFVIKNTNTKQCLNFYGNDLEMASVFTTTCNQGDRAQIFEIVQKGNSFQIRDALKIYLEAGIHASHVGLANPMLNKENPTINFSIEKQKQNFYKIKTRDGGCIYSVDKLMIGYSREMCENKNNKQHFEFIEVSDARLNQDKFKNKVVLIESVGTNKCLSSSNKNSIGFSRCDTNSKTQQFRINIRKDNWINIISNDNAKLSGDFNSPRYTITKDKENKKQRFILVANYNKAHLYIILNRSIKNCLYSKGQNISTKVCDYYQAKPKFVFKIMTIDEKIAKDKKIKTVKNIVKGIKNKLRGKAGAQAREQSRRNIKSTTNSKKPNSNKPNSNKPNSNKPKSNISKHIKKWVPSNAKKNMGKKWKKVNTATGSKDTRKSLSKTHQSTKPNKSRAARKNKKRWGSKIIQNIRRHFSRRSHGRKTKPKGQNRSTKSSPKRKNHRRRRSSSRRPARSNKPKRRPARSNKPKRRPVTRPTQRNQPKRSPSKSFPLRKHKRRSFGSRIKSWFTKVKRHVGRSLRRGRRHK